MLNIAVFEWRLDDWLVMQPLRGSAKEWFATQSRAVRAGLQAVAASIRNFKSLNPNVPVLLVTNGLKHAAYGLDEGGAAKPLTQLPSCPGR